MKALTSFDGVRRSELVAVVRGVGKSFDECLTWSLKEVTFGVRRGEVFGLAGPSGSGKTALLKLLAGHLRPTEGKVKVFGSSPRRGAKKSRIGYLPQTSGPNNHANSGGVLDWVGGLFRRTETRQNPAAAESRDKTRWRGELAQTIYGKRDLVILDEPFSNLEPSERGELKNLIETLAQQGKTVILSSSSLEDVLGVCQRIAVLNGGRMEILGTLDELQASPEAVRALAPILPEPVAQKLQGIVREYLANETHSNTTLVRVGKKSSVNWEKGGPHTATSTGPTLQHDSQQPSRRELFTCNPDDGSKSAANPVNHEKLSKLISPRATAPKLRSSPKVAESFDAEAKANEKLSALVAKPK